MNMLIMGLVSEASGAGSLIQYGAVGICLLALAGYYVLKDLRYEARINEMREMEKAFRKEQAEQQQKFRDEQGAMVEKYRQAMEKVSQSLDIVISLMKGGK